VLVEVVDLKLTDILIVGIGAIWVEIVRNKDTEGSYTTLSKKGKGKKEGVPKYFGWRFGEQH
jgi:hypothetical protein